MKVHGSQLELLFDCQQEKVQTVGAQVPTASEASLILTNGMGVWIVTFLYEVNISIHFTQFLKLVKAH